jgi:hypothetical protein
MHGSLVRKYLATVSSGFVLQLLALEVIEYRLIGDEGYCLGALSRALTQILDLIRLIALIMISLLGGISSQLSWQRRAFGHLALD